MALTSREVVKVMVKRSVETVIVGRDAGDVIESGIELLGFIEVKFPLGVGVGFDAVEQARSLAAAILRLEAVDIGRLRDK